MPQSNRPPVPSFSAPPIPSQLEDTFAIDEDIYEETDEILPSMSSMSPTNAPSLPNRNPPKANTTTSGPSLPPRNAPTSSSPRLPPRSSPGKYPPQDYEMTQSPKLPAKAPPASLPVDDEDGELYDDVVLGGDDVEELYDDVLMGGQEEEELYDDVLTAVGENEGTAIITDEFYEDMAATSSVPDSYVSLEKQDDDLDSELYVDVEEPIVKKALSVPSPKSSITKMFKKAPISAGGSPTTLSGNISYKAPKKSKFEDRWGVLEGSYLLIFKTSSDKRSQDKIPLGDCRLDIGSTEAGAGKFAFSLSKGDKFYHMSVRDQVELNKWVDTLKGIVKYAPVQTGALVEEEPEIYEATQDHIANSSDELTFRKGTCILLLEKKTADIWFGQIKDEFKGSMKKGKFPVSKVQLAENPYIYQ